MQLVAIREHNKDQRPLGQPPQPEEAPSEPEDEAPLGSPPPSDGSSEFNPSDDDDDDDEMVI